MGLFRNYFRRLYTNNNRFTPLENQIHYYFSDIRLLEQAFTHRSINPNPRHNYERLEFLGDAVVDIIVSRALIAEFSEGDEGLLTQKRAALVQKSFLASMGNLMNLIDYLKIESTVNLDQEKIASKQKANLFEALIGAIYIDGGIEPCRKLVKSTIWANREEAWQATNYKGRLIEWCHSSSIGNPRFCVSNVTGPDHQKIFEVYVKIGDKTFPAGFGSNKKTAEQSAAQIALETITG